MSKKVIILLIGLIFLLASCTSSNSSKSDQSSGKIQKNPTPILKNTVVKLDNFSFQFLNYSLIKSKNDAIKDSVNICEKIGNSSIDSTKLGFDIGLNSSKPEVTKRDSYLLLKVKYKLNENASQRDSIIPKMDIKAVDNEGDDLILLHNSMDDKYIQVENPIGILIFKMFGDSKTINFGFDGDEYKLKLK